MTEGQFARLFIVIAISCCSSAQNLGNNYGINFRLHQNALDYAMPIAIDELYEKVRQLEIPDVDEDNILITEINLKELTKPTATLTINQGQGFSANVALTKVRITGDFKAKYTLVGIKLSKSGPFTARVESVSAAVKFSVRADRSGRPVISVTSCTQRVGFFQVKIDRKNLTNKLYNWIIKKITNYLKRKFVDKEICNQVGKLTANKVNSYLQKFEVSTTVQDPRLRLDYSLLRSPQYGIDYIDATFKADVSWKGKSTGTPSAQRQWPTIPGTESNMLTIHITDYLMNALGTLMHNAGDLSYNVTRDMVSKKIRPRLSLKCKASGVYICMGTLLPKLAKQYPDGWMEAGLRMTSPPRLTLADGSVRVKFAGDLEVYVATPDGNRISVASVISAWLYFGLALSIRDYKIVAKLETPQISIAGTVLNDKAMKTLLELISTGFTNVELDKIGQDGLDLPTFDNVALTNPQIFLRSDMIVVSTNITFGDSVKSSPPNVEIKFVFGFSTFLLLLKLLYHYFESACMNCQICWRCIGRVP